MYIAVPTVQLLKNRRLSNLHEEIEKNGFEIIKETAKGEPSFTFIDARKI